MNQSTRERLVAYIAGDTERAVTDDNIIDTILCGGKDVYEGKRERHRWFTMIPIVTYFEKLGMYISYDFCDVDGESSDVNDCIGGYKLEDFHEVEPYEETVTVTKYKRIDSE